MPINTKDFESLTDDLQEIFAEHSRRSIADQPGLDLFEVKDTMRKTYDYLVLHGMSGIESVAEGADFPKATAEEGDTATWTQTHYGVDVPVTKDMRKFDLYDRIEGVVRSTTDDAWDKVDQSLADVLGKGWSTSYTNIYGDSVSAVCPDGLALFSTAHTNPVSGQTFQNVINDGTNDNPALSRTALKEMRARGLTHKDPNGMVRPIRYNTVMVPPSLEDLALRLVNTERLPQSADNDINPVSRWVDSVIVWPRLETAGDGTDTSAYWYMIDSGAVGDSLKAKFAERPSLDAPDVVYRNKDWEFTLDFYYAIGRGYPAFVAGSKGTS